MRITYLQVYNICNIFNIYLYIKFFLEVIGICLLKKTMD